MVLKVVRSQGRVCAIQEKHSVQKGGFLCWQRLVCVITWGDLIKSELSFKTPHYSVPYYKCNAPYLSESYYSTEKMNYNQPHPCFEHLGSRTNILTYLERFRNRYCAVHVHSVPVCNKGSTKTGPALTNWKRTWGCDERNHVINRSNLSKGFLVLSNLSKGFLVLTFQWSWVEQDF